MTRPLRIIVAMSGATGAPFGVRLLEALRDIPEVETHLILSTWARTTIELETAHTVRQVVNLADIHHKLGDQGSVLSSGSFPTDGMVVVPCSMKTLASIRTGYADNLIVRAADVALKERRRLVLVPRETPLSEIHLDHMLALSRMGARIVPPMPAFYNNPETIDDLIDHIVARILDQFELPTPTTRGWQGLDHARHRTPSPAQAQQDDSGDAEDMAGRPAQEEGLPAGRHPARTSLPQSTSGSSRSGTETQHTANRYKLGCCGG